jgi:hypothetical protein
MTVTNGRRERTDHGPGHANPLPKYTDHRKVPKREPVK